MITENDLHISNKSYINKDFPVIYQELVDLAKKLSYKFDPETSNESDPFVTIMKLLAFIGDKTNYNVDKNVLERFMPSATQESSMRELCGMLGYNVKYYVAPTTSVTFKYTGKDLDSGESFILPKLETIITNDNFDVTYVTMRDVVIYSTNDTSDSIPVIQGVVKTLLTLNGDKVRLENLDDEHRIYFPEKMVAQNGIFIEGGNLSLEDEWTYVDNLNTTPPNSFVYKFGYDSQRRLPYIQFPDDITNLIGDGLTIKYVITNGLDGNVKARALTKLNAPTSVDVTGSTKSITLVTNDESFIQVKNINASINGDDPETIERAYSNFKKTIGTFDTLVTCRDYMNYIYNMLDDDNIYPLVSNIIVSDRRSDYNYSNNIVTYNDYGQISVNVSDSNAITAFDLVLYPLNPIKVYNTDSYNFSFKPLMDVNKITFNLEDAKSISHDYIKPEDLSPQDVYAFKNYYKLNAKISTTYKVNDYERDLILYNINQALIKHFNARELDFGYEIPYDTLLKVIEGADARIKLVSLAEPEITTKVMTSDLSSAEMPLVDGSNNTPYLNMIAKNVLAGKVELFDYNELFDYDFGQKQVATASDMLYEGIEHVTTRANIELDSDDQDGTTLGANEVVQFITPSLITDITYPYGIGYTLVLNNSDYIPQNEEYELRSNEHLVFIYNDTNDIQQVIIYGSGDIIKPNIDLYTTSKRIEMGQTPRTVKVNGRDREALEDIGIISPSDNGIVKIYTLGTNEKVEHRRFNEETVTSSTYVYWLVNNDNNEIVFDTNNEYMLEDGEYFFRTDASFKDLYSYGSGTIIKLTDVDDITWVTPKVDISEIDENGILGLQDRFKHLSLNSSSYITFKEQAIYTAIEGDVVRCALEEGESSSQVINLTNTFTTLPSGIKLSINDDMVIPSLNFTGSYIKGRSLLDINAGPSLAQTLINNQELDILDENDEVIATLEAGSSFNLSVLKQLGGGNNISIGTENYLVSGDVRIVPNDIYCYELDTEGSLNKSTPKYASLTLGAGEQKDLVVPDVGGKDLLMMIYCDKGGATVSGDAQSTIINYSTGSAFVDDELNKGVNILDLTDVNQLTLENSTNEDITLIISNPRVVNTVVDGTTTLGYNKAFRLESSDESDLRSILQAMDADKDGNHIFYYCNYVDNAKAVDTDNFKDPYVLFDYNNVANKHTISEIDFNDSSIDIVRSSRV